MNIINKAFVSRLKNTCTIDETRYSLELTSMNWYIIIRFFIFLFGTSSTTPCRCSYSVNIVITFNTIETFRFWGLLLYRWWWWWLLRHPYQFLFFTNKKDSHQNKNKTNKFNKSKSKATRSRRRRRKGGCRGSHGPLSSLRSGTGRSAGLRGRGRRREWWRKAPW